MQPAITTRGMCRTELIGVQCPLSGLLLFFQSCPSMSYFGLAAGVRPKKEHVFHKDLEDSSEAHKLLDVNVLVY